MKKLLSSGMIFAGAFLIFGAGCGSKNLPQPQPGSPVTTTPPYYAPTSTGAGMGSDITLANNDQTINIQVGGRFNLKLSDKTWNIEISDPSVIKRVNTIPATKGSQGVYEGVKPGQATVMAKGPSTFKVNITVSP